LVTVKAANWLARDTCEGVVIEPKRQPSFNRDRTMASIGESLTLEQGDLPGYDVVHELN
jgi:hypothetical protein